MTVRELINKLIDIENKDTKVMIKIEHSKGFFIREEKLEIEDNGFVVLIKTKEGTIWK